MVIWLTPLPLKCQRGLWMPLSMGPCSLGHSSFRTVQCWEEKSFTFRTSYNSSKPSVPCRQYYYSSHCASIPNVLSKKLQQLKLKILQKNLPNRCFMWAGQGKILILEKRIHFFLWSLALSVPIYRKFKSNDDKWQSLKRWTCMIFLSGSMFQTSLFSPVWLKISKNWYTKNQRSKKKWIRFYIGKIYPCSAPVIRVVLLDKTSGLCNPFCPLVHVKCQSLFVYLSTYKTFS